MPISCHFRNCKALLGHCKKSYSECWTLLSPKWPYCKHSCVFALYVAVRNEKLWEYMLGLALYSRQYAEWAIAYCRASNPDLSEIEQRRHRRDQWSRATRCRQEMKQQQCRTKWHLVVDVTRQECVSVIQRFNRLKVYTATCIFTNTNTHPNPKPNPTLS